MQALSLKGSKAKVIDGLEKAPNPADPLMGMALALAYHMVMDVQLPYNEGMHLKLEKQPMSLSLSIEPYPVDLLGKKADGSPFTSLEELEAFEDAQKAAE